ncbi:hypothetical protein GJ496_005458 [Pomphorhynchus laevis]|nr:hypothetical protein GJ496_005458 [Pomphorhynchus laevis]
MFYIMQLQLTTAYKSHCLCCQDCRFNKMQLKLLTLFCLLFTYTVQHALYKRQIDEEVRDLGEMLDEVKEGVDDIHNLQNEVDDRAEEGVDDKKSDEDQAKQALEDLNFIQITGNNYTIENVNVTQVNASIVSFAVVSPNATYNVSTIMVPSTNFTYFHIFEVQKTEGENLIPIVFTAAYKNRETGEYHDVKKTIGGEEADHSVALGDNVASEGEKAAAELDKLAAEGDNIAAEVDKAAVEGDKAAAEGGEAAAGREDFAAESDAVAAESEIVHLHNLDEHLI